MPPPPLFYFFSANPLFNQSTTFSEQLPHQSAIGATQHSHPSTKHPHGSPSAQNQSQHSPNQPHIQGEFKNLASFFSTLSFELVLCLGFA